MNMDCLDFHHFGLATKSPDRAQQFLHALGYTSSDQIRDELQNVDLILCTHDTEPDVEIISATDTAGPLDEILSGQAQNIYHICYETDAIEIALERLQEKGIRCQCISPPTPAILFGGRNVAFYFVRGFGLIELLEST